MIIHSLITIVFCSSLLAGESKNDERYLFFLHNRFLEENELSDLHPQYGQTEYVEIINEFEKSGFTVISEIRNGKLRSKTVLTRQSN